MHTSTTLRLLIVGLLVAESVSWSTEVSAADPPQAKPRASDSINPAKLVVADERGVQQELTTDKFSRLPRASTDVVIHGTKACYSGVLLVDLLKSAGVQLDQDLRGQRVSTVAILDAADGYRVVISLLEIDPATNDRKAIVANRRDGEPLAAQEGPYRLIVPRDKRPVRWIRNLQSIHLVNLADFPLPNATETTTDDKPKSKG